MSLPPTAGAMPLANPIAFTGNGYARVNDLKDKLGQSVVIDRANLKLSNIAHKLLSQCKKIRQNLIASNIAQRFIPGAFKPRHELSPYIRGSYYTVNETKTNHFSNQIRGE